MLKKISTTTACMIAAVGFAFGEPAVFYKNPDGLPMTQFKAEGPKGMVASSSVHASEIGVAVLRAGGNAVDATVAVSFAISVTRPQSTGLGGGGFLLYFDAATGETPVFDFRETAPAAAYRDMYVRDGKAVPALSREGGLAVGVPGTVAGLIEVHKRYGSKPLAALIQPAIDLAEDGFPVYPELARRLAGRADILAKDLGMRGVFFDKAGTVLKEGDRLVQPDLAKTLIKIKDQGAAGFYTGPVAEAVAGAADLMTVKDLADYKVAMREPVRGTYRGFEVVSMPPPSSGGTHLVQMLNVLEGYNLRTHGLHTPRTLHLFAETMRSAYTDRAEYMGDSGFVDVPLKWLTDKSYAEEIRAQISPERARKSSATKPGRVLAESPETTHISIVDAQGNAVSTTQTINYGFGACIMAAGTGVIMNNEMDDFSAQPGVPNLFGLVGGDAKCGRCRKASVKQYDAYVFNAGWQTGVGAGGARWIQNYYCGASDGGERRGFRTAVI